jgi:hypothetical protein
MPDKQRVAMTHDLHAVASSGEVVLADEPNSVS